MAGEKAIEKSLEPVVKKGFEGFWRRNYGVGVARDESALRRLVVERGKAGAELSKARSAVAGLDARAAELEAGADRKLATFNAEQSRINRNALVDLWHTGNEHAVEVAKAEQLARLNTEGVKLSADIQKMSEEALALRTPTSEAAKPAYDALKKASLDFEAKVAEARAQQLREKSLFGFRWNTESGWYTAEKYRKGKLPPFKTPVEVPFPSDELAVPAKVVSHFTSGRGNFPRYASGLFRKVAAGVSPVRMDGRIGRGWDYLTSPGLFSGVGTAFVGGVATAAAYGAGYLMGFEWATPNTKLLSIYGAKRVNVIQEVKNAEASGIPNRIENAKAEYDKIQKRYAELVKAVCGKDAKVDDPLRDPPLPSKVDVANTTTNLAKITQDYRMTGDAVARDNAIASMPKETVEAALSAIRSNVFKAHYPGQDMETLGRTEAGRKFIGDFDAHVFGSRSANDWLTTDMGAYRRNLEESQIGR